MMTINVITELLGWSSVINIGVLIFSGIIVILMRKSISKFHAKFFGLNEMDLGRAYFQLLAQYEVAIIVLNIVPYLALKIMA